MSEANAEDGLLWSWTIENVKMSEAQYRNRICIFLSAPNFAKRNQRSKRRIPPQPPPPPLAKAKSVEVLRKPFPQKNASAKPSPHCSATCPNTWRAEHQRKMSFPLSKEISPPPNQESKEHFSLVLPREARQWRNDTSVRGSFKPPRASRVRLVGVRIISKIHSNFVQYTPPIGK